MTREWTVEEATIVPAPATTVYRAIADPHSITRWSPECRAVWTRHDGPAPAGSRFVGWNRRSAWVWFTTCRVDTADTDREFAFTVTSFGLPVARWGYRLAPAPDGTEVTEYWEDLRRPGVRGRLAAALGLVFTGTPAADRAERNRAGMRETLQRMSADLASRSRP